MRIHITAASLIIPFAYFFGISRCEWAVLFCIIGAVFSAELANTGIEHASDAVTSEASEEIRRAKDAAASSVLSSAVCSVFVGIFLFGDIKKISATLVYIATTPLPAVLFLCIIAANAVLHLKTK